MLSELGSPSTLLSNWTGDPCTGRWVGVTCSGTTVVALDLRVPVVTTSPPPSLRWLTGLTSVTFQGNTLAGGEESPCRLPFLPVTKVPKRKHGDVRNS